MSERQGLRGRTSAENNARTEGRMAVIGEKQTVSGEQLFAK